MNPNIDKLQPYPFQRLAALKEGITPPHHLNHIALSIGEPKHPTPAFITEEVITHLHGLAAYPTTMGSLELRKTIANWLTQRFSLQKDSLDTKEQILPVSGTREALFSFTQAIMDGSPDACAVLPNPFYQIYEGATLLAGGKTIFANSTQQNHFLADYDAIPASVWQNCQCLFICTPGNPTGAVIDLETLKKLIQLSDKYDFVIASDECYSEIYQDENTPPPGLLQACAALNRNDYKRCVVFHSLSKRSNAPGLRSGFVAGDADILKKYFQYRTYHGATMPVHTQAASIVAWRDEKHVKHNRELYREKFDAVLNILSDVVKIQCPPAGFYLWPDIGGDDTHFARDLYASQNVTVLPGSYLSRSVNGTNPGQGYVRMALVAPLDECIDAANRIKDFINMQKSL